MTGRDLILYILENNLEDEPVYENGKLIGMSTIKEAAVKMKTGPQTIQVWIGLGRLPAITIGTVVYIPDKYLKGTL